MSTVAHIIKQIRALPYADMMVVTGEIRDRIHDLTQQRIEANTLAEILSRLNTGNKLAASDETKEEEKVLREIFRIKRALSVQRHGNGGWAVEINAVPGSQVVHTELRAAFGMMLDQIITLHVLTKK